MRCQRCQKSQFVHLLSSFFSRANMAPTLDSQEMFFITEPRPDNVQFEASKLKVLHKNGNHSRADDSWYVAHYLASFITKTAYYDMTRAHSPYRYKEKAAH